MLNLQITELLSVWSHLRSSQAFCFVNLQVLTGNRSEQLEQKQKHLRTLVMRACNEMTEKLITGGAEINCMRSDGLTPAMLALSNVNILSICDSLNLPLGSTVGAVDKRSPPTSVTRVRFLYSPVSCVRKPEVHW